MSDLIANYCRNACDLRKSNCFFFFFSTAFTTHANSINRTRLVFPYSDNGVRERLIREYTLNSDWWPRDLTLRLSDRLLRFPFYILPPHPRSVTYTRKHIEEVGVEDLHLKEFLIPIKRREFCRLN